MDRGRGVARFPTTAFVGYRLVLPGVIAVLLTTGTVAAVWTRGCAVVSTHGREDEGRELTIDPLRDARASGMGRQGVVLS